ncbi:hypothetical protein JL720_12590 [Aureococcus anophagefferens]|nr:hypothetical protein JL720_12590 [Aureococcus anophagefferens]
MAVARASSPCSSASRQDAVATLPTPNGANAAASRVKKSSAPGVAATKALPVGAKATAATDVTARASAAPAAAPPRRKRPRCLTSSRSPKGASSSSLLAPSTAPASRAFDTRNFATSTFCATA